MKRAFLALAAVTGLAVCGPVAADIEFYDLPANTATLIGGRSGLSALTIDIFTNLASWTGYTATLELLLSDDEAQPDGERAVVADLNNDAIEIVHQDTVARWYAWEGNVADFLRPGQDSKLFFGESLRAHPDNKDFLYYNARLVFSVVPEASQWLLLGAGLLAAAGVARRSRLSQ